MGGYSFIATNFIQYLFKHYPTYEIVNVDKITYAANPTTYKKVKKERYKFYYGDICDYEKMEEIFGIEKPDVVVNFAASTHVDNSIRDAGDFINTNICGVYTLLKLCKIDQFRMIQISSDEVFSDLPLDSKEKFCLDTPYNPHSPYSASKAGGDLLVKSYVHTFALPVILTNSSNNFGPYQHVEKFIPKVITNALQDKEIPVYGKGNNIRDWIYVEDFCLALDCVLHRGTVGKQYLIGGECEKTNNEVANLILDIMKKPQSLLTYVQDRLGHDRRYAIDCSSMKSLGWQPQPDFEGNLKKTVSWYKNNLEWVKHCKTCLV